MKAPHPETRLTGEHVVVEPMGEQHLSGLSKAGSDTDTWIHLPVTPPRSEDDWRTFLRDAHEARDRGDEVPFVLVDRKSGVVAGSTRYLDIQLKHSSLEIGWTFLAPAFRRTAINTEAKLLLLTNAFEALDAVRVSIKTDGRNLRSQRAIERLGAVREGTLRKHRRMPDGYMRDSVYYSVLADEWPAVRERLRGFLAAPRAANS